MTNGEGCNGTETLSNDDQRIVSCWSFNIQDLVFLVFTVSVSLYFLK